MFEYHGWATVQLSAGDEEPEETQAFHDRIAELVEPLADTPGLASLQWVNGALQFHIAGYLNRRGQQGREVIDTFHAIGKVAPGSYGILYVHDDEDGSSSNASVAHVMRRGQVVDERDGFLSPVVPTIEDE